jgi:hypothetical protein
MKTIRISPRARSIAALLKEAQGENLVLTLADGSEFILAEIDAFDQEVKLTRQNQQVMDLLEQRAKQVKRVSLNEAKKRLGIEPHVDTKTKRSVRRQPSVAKNAA